MLKIADIEDTPNPNAQKFVLYEPLSWGIAHSYDNAEQAEGDELARKVAVPVRAAPAATAQSTATVAAAQVTLDHLSERDRERLNKIELLLDQQVRPYLRGDGSDLHIVDFHADRLTVHYQGACGTCPSSISGTLQSIENLLRTIEPGLEVVAY